ncbi:SIMPL domain-containing protein [Alteromonas sp. 1_MG-2023]|uniref:SIMPL domain-containing protein n=1 Tax=Alteromonas sp. 1_MG-2023 TaxID=3062669 RepID=UPI0026E3BD98|nr:SIMPL domain-containing protein [Alteromonas sp. 1_MG-2023]MDO6565892.1 SIMPL domain-containing protein [Alteromonas sp. 1_MG-2023]
MNSIKQLLAPVMCVLSRKQLLSVVLASSMAAVLISSPAYAEHQQPLIHVQGSGAVSVVPNAYSVTLIIEEQGKTVGKLNTTLASDLRSVVNFLLEQGIERNNIQSMQVRLNPRYINSPNGRVQDGFTLSREISVTDSNIENYDKVLDGVLGRGVDRIQQFSFVSTSEGNAYQTALLAAVKDAKARAALLAKELGVEVGEVVAISESGGNMPVPVMRADAFAKEMSVSLPGQETVEARINVSFSIIQ